MGQLPQQQILNRSIDHSQIISLGHGGRQKQTVQTGQQEYIVGSSWLRTGKLPQDCLWVSNCPYYDMISIYQQRRKLQMLRDGEEKAKRKIALISGRQDKRNMGSNLSNNGDFVYTHLMG